MTPVYDDEVVGRRNCCGTMSPAPDGWTYHDPDCGLKKYIQTHEKGGKNRFTKAGYEKYRIIPRPASPSPDLPTWTGWISRDGEFYSCDYAGHRYLAERIALTLGYFKEGDWALPDRILEEKGWIQTKGANFKEKTHWMICILSEYKMKERLKPTSKQLDTLFDLAVKYDGMKLYNEFVKLYCD